MGYDNESPAYVLHLIAKNKLMKSRNVTFHEEIFPGKKGQNASAKFSGFPRIPTVGEPNGTHENAMDAHIPQPIAVEQEEQEPHWHVDVQEISVKLKMCFLKITFVTI